LAHAGWSPQDTWPTLYQSQTTRDSALIDATIRYYSSSGGWPVSASYLIIKWSPAMFFGAPLIIPLKIIQRTLRI
jgi:hypothetical protein